MQLAPPTRLPSRPPSVANLYLGGATPRERIALPLNCIGHSALAQFHQDLHLTDSSSWRKSRSPRHPSESTLSGLTPRASSGARAPQRFRPRPPARRLLQLM